METTVRPYKFLRVRQSTQMGISHLIRSRENVQGLGVYLDRSTDLILSHEGRTVLVLFSLRIGGRKILSFFK